MMKKIYIRSYVAIKAIIMICTVSLSHLVKIQSRNEFLVEGSVACPKFYSGVSFYPSTYLDKSEFLRAIAHPALSLFPTPMYGSKFPFYHLIT